MVNKRLSLPLVFVIATALSGCNSKVINDNWESTKSGLSSTLDGLSNTVAGDCEGTAIVSKDANQSIKLKSSEDQTYFYVDGKKVNEKPAKFLKVCINNKQEHTITAKPIDCKEKIESLEPPYNNTFYEFQFMLGECHLSNNENSSTVNSSKGSNVKKKSKSKKSNS